MSPFSRLAVAALVGAATLPGTAFARKPVLTQNADEPGRSPYQQSLSKQPGDNECVPFLCILRFSQVPAGKRFVVTYVNIGISTSPSSPAFARLTNSPPNFSLLLPFISEISFSGSSVYRVAGGPMTLYFGPGDTPVVQAFRASRTDAILVGYLVSIP